MKNREKLLVLAPSRQTRGGITAVVAEYSQTGMWKDWNCHWIETHIDTTKTAKIIYFVKALFSYIHLLPSADIIHIHLSEPVSAIRKAFFFLPALIARKKIITHFHSFSTDSTLNGRYKALYRFLFSNSDTVIVLSNFWKNELISSLGKNIPVQILYNPSLSMGNLAKHSSQERLPFVLFAGTLNERKGFKDLIRAFAIIADDFPEWNLVFAGNGEISQGEITAQKLGIEDRVKFVGWVSGLEKDKIFREASIFCLPSYAEGFPMAILDAMTYCIPTIATSVGGIEDVFSDENELLIFSPGDIKKLSYCISRMIEDFSLRDRLVSNSSKIISTDFDINVLSKKMDSIYKFLHDDN